MSQFDYVVVGAGSAGCAVAGRLGATGASVLVLEAGGSDRRLQVRMPLGFAALMQTAADWNYESEPEPGLFGRQLYVPRGRILGGTSSMNASIYMRGDRTCFDRWERDYGAVGWSYADVLPAFKRSEDNADFADEYHGQGGELHVTLGERWRSSLWRGFVESAVEVGIPRNRDFNGERQAGAGELQVTIRRGRRWSSADAFLRPVMGRDNVTVLTRALVHRVVLDRGRAVAVEYSRRRRLRRVDVSGEVILCGGAYNSPQVLMRSGIGPAEHLREVGITPLLDSPQVGRNLQDHPLTVVSHRAPVGATLDDAGDPRELVRWLALRRGKLSSNVGEAAVHWRSDPSLESPDFQIFFGPANWSSGFRRSGIAAMCLVISYVGPSSRGRVKLRSADPAAAPRICQNILSRDSEVDACLRALELAREIAARRPFTAAAGEELQPGAVIATRQQLRDWLRATSVHTYHPSCSCRIGPPGEGVVAPDLRVHGVDGLRVADTSVMPEITSGNTNAPAIMIGERCAEFVLAGGG